MIIGKLYEISNSYVKPVFSSAFGKNGCELRNVIGHIDANDIVLFLGELNKEYGSTKWLKILTSDGVVGYIGNYDSNNWKLVETI